MNTFDRTNAMRATSSPPAIQARGCLISFEQTPQDAALATEAEQARQRHILEKGIEERCEKYAQNLRKEQRKRCECCEAQLKQTFQTMDSDIRKQLISLSIRIAEIILRRELPDTDMLRQVLADTLQPISDLRGVRVRLAPGDAANLHGGMSDSASQYPGVDWVEDANLSPGDVLVESRNGYFDGRIHERLAFLAEALEKTAVQLAQPHQ